MDKKSLEQHNLFSQPCRRLDFDLRDESPTQKVGQEVQCNVDDNLDVEPRLGMEFISEDKAYDFYNQYARKIGFSIRRSSLKKSDDNDNVIIKRTFCCSKEGFRKEDKRTIEATYHRAITRIGCQAQMVIKLQKNGKYIVSNFVPEHNHEVMTPSKVHMLRSHRAVNEVQKVEVNMADESGITPKTAIEFFSKQAGGRENVGFTAVDYKNYLQKKRMKEMEKGDAGAVLEYFQKMLVENPSFFYAIQVDKDDQITNIFWADAKSILDYSYFGDVVCFDTTYRINSYSRPFAPFVGVNHHKQTVIFGAALLYDETTASFKWLFETFLSAMSGKSPKTILTDQSTAIGNAVASMMPETYHRLCVWHIYQNAAKHLSHVFHGSKTFEYDFNRCVYDYEEEGEFINAWNDMLEKYDLKENKWLRDLFKEREKWALVYGRNTFCADMKSTQRSESMNNVLKKYLNSKHNLLRFFKHYERVLSDRRYEESKADFKMRQSIPVLFIDVKMLREAAKSYTPEVFQVFQNEYKKFLEHEIQRYGEIGTVTEFRVFNCEKNEGRTVKYDSSDSTVMCSCKKFEFMGILCSHALKVLDYYNVKVLLDHYILKRWRRDAKVSIVKDHHEIEVQGDPKDALSKRYRFLYQNFIKTLTMAVENDQAFKLATEYSIRLYEAVTECIKNSREAPVMTSQIIDESADTESEDDQLDEKQFTFVDSLGSQVVSGIKRKPKIKENRGMFKNPLDKGKKKRSQSEFVQPLQTQEKNESTQAFTTNHPPLSTQITQSSHVPVMSGFNNAPWNYNPIISGFNNAQWDYYKHSIPNANMFHNFWNIRSQNLQVARPSQDAVHGGSHVGYYHHRSMANMANSSGSTFAPLSNHVYQPNTNLNHQNPSTISQQSLSFSSGNQSIRREDHPHSNK